MTLCSYALMKHAYTCLLWYSMLAILIWSIVFIFVNFLFLLAGSSIPHPVPFSRCLSFSGSPPRLPLSMCLISADHFPITFLSVHWICVDWQSVAYWCSASNSGQNVIALRIFCPIGRWNQVPDGDLDKAPLHFAIPPATLWPTCMLTRV